MFLKTRVKTKSAYGSELIFKLKKTTHLQSSTPEMWSLFEVMAQRADKLLPTAASERNCREDDGLGVERYFYDMFPSSDCLDYRWFGADFGDSSDPMTSTAWTQNALE